MFIKRSDNGAALISVIIITVVFVTLGAAVLYLALNDYKIAKDEVASTKALYAAEGGIRKFIVELNNNPDYDLWGDDIWSGLENHPVADAKIKEVEIIEDNSDNVRIKVVGTFEDAQKTLFANVSKPQTGLSEVLKGVTVTSSTEELKLSGNTEFIGDVYFTGNVDIQIEVVGNVYAEGEVDIFGNGNVTGEIHENWEVSDFPMMDYDWFRTSAEQQGQYFDNSEDFYDGIEMDNLSGIYFVEGDIDLGEINENSYLGEGVIAASGDITGVGNTDLTPDTEDSSLALISKGNITVNGNNSFKGVLIAEGTLFYNSNSDITGAIVVEDIDQFKGDFTYDETYWNIISEEIEEISDIAGGSARLLKWEEQYPVY